MGEPAGGVCDHIDQNQQDSPGGLSLSPNSSVLAVMLDMQFKVEPRSDLQWSSTQHPINVGVFAVGEDSRCSQQCCGCDELVVQASRAARDSCTTVLFGPGNGWAGHGNWVDNSNAYRPGQ
jgi:hypothetical protein